MKNALTEIRCGHCRKKLAEGEFIRLAIKCPRCGTLNDLSAKGVIPGTVHERHGAPVLTNRNRHDRFEHQYAR